MLSENKSTVVIKIGEIYASKKPAVISTLLGSCVAVCIYDRKNRVGGMNHIFLPSTPDIKKNDTSARYGENAMKRLIQKVIVLGGDNRQIVAKVFGGAQIIPALSQSHQLSVGPKIVNFVKNFLHKEDIDIITQDLGGNKARKVYFHTDTGQVFVKKFYQGFHNKP